MKKKLFWQIFLILCLSILLVFGVGVWAVNYNNRQMVEERLIMETNLLATMIDDQEDISQLRASVSGHDYRITIIQANGDVIYDNRQSTIANHADREEVQSALNGTPYITERYSATFDCRMTYYASATHLADGEVVVLRLAVPSREIHAYLTVAIPLLLLTLGIALLIAGWLASRLSHRLSHKIQRVAVSLRSLQRGTYRPIQTSKREPEFYAVLEAINEVNESILHHISINEQEKEKLNAVLDHVAQGIIALDPFENVVFANNSAFTLFDGDEKDIGRHLIYLVDEAPLCQAIGDQTKKGGRFEHTYRERELSVAVQSIQDENLTHAIAAIVIVTDITREKQMVREKSEFFANASHELKTPVTVMQGLAEVMLTKDQLDDTAKKQVTRIHKESVRMADLIADMLKLSHLERQEEDVPSVVVDLRTVTDEVLAELAPRTQDKGLTVTVTGQGKIQADPQKIYELLANLCSNALNYNKENGRLDVSIATDDAYTTLTVADTGIGIAKEHLPRLCERFYRIDKSRSKKTGGTGLGLAIVKHICALYGAELKIDSELGVGSTVTVSFHH